MTDATLKPAAKRSAAKTPAKPAFRPFIPASVVLPELTILHLIIGAVLGVIFGASSLYLVLKVGLTVSASIPVAVISITLLRLLQSLGIAKASILQNNIVQTAGSAGESIAFGLGVTMPAIMILGFDMEIARVMLVAVLGGLLGILMMIPLRRALIVEQHGILKYPEGTACAEVLKAGATREEHEMGHEASHAQTEAEVAHGARTIVAGFGLGLVYKLAEGAFKLWKDTPETIFGAPLAKASLAAEISPELLGVGYIIGPRIAATMAAGRLVALIDHGAAAADQAPVAVVELPRELRADGVRPDPERVLLRLGGIEGVGGFAGGLAPVREEVAAGELVLLDLVAHLHADPGDAAHDLAGQFDAMGGHDVAGGVEQDEIVVRGGGGGAGGSQMKDFHVDVRVGSLPLPIADACAGQEDEEQYPGPRAAAIAAGLLAFVDAELLQVRVHVHSGQASRMACTMSFLEAP